jgi:hypothetical protein
MTIMEIELEKERSETRLQNQILRRRSGTGYMATCAAFLSFIVLRTGVRKTKSRNCHDVLS